MNYSKFLKYRVVDNWINIPSYVELYFCSYDAASTAACVIDDLFRKCTYITISNALNVIFDLPSEPEERLNYFGWDHEHYDISKTRITEVSFSGFPEITHKLTISGIIKIPEV